MIVPVQPGLKPLRNKLLIHAAIMAACGLAPCIAPAADPQFAAPVSAPFGLVSYGSDPKIELGDLDGDGDFDALLGSLFGDVFFHKNTGSRAVPAFAPASLDLGIPDFGFLSTPSLSDGDEDGDLDLLIGTLDGVISLAGNAGTPSVPAFNSVGPFFDIGNSAAPEMIDIDGDGDLDLFSGGKLPKLVFYRNTATLPGLLFDPPVDNPFGITGVAAYSIPAFADVDGDGDFDLFCASYDGNIAFFRNTGNSTNPTFAASTNFPFGLSSIGTGPSLAFADMDLDGDVDCLACPKTQPCVYFRNSKPDTAPPTVVSISQLNSATTDDDSVLFKVSFSEGIATNLSPNNLILTGSLAGASQMILPSAVYNPNYYIAIRPNNPNANGTIGFQIQGLVRDFGNNSLTVPVLSQLYTIANHPPGDVNKDGTFGIADVALLGDANLGLVTLP